MRVVALVSQKGGAGKTTLATNLAVEAERQGLATLLLDLDPQASAATWKDVRGGDAPDVVAAQAPRLPKLLEAAREQAIDLVLIDTAPNADAAALAAAQAADVVLVPCRASAFDLGAIAASLRLCAEVAARPSFVVLNGVPPTSRIADEAAAALAAGGARLAPVRFGHRMDFVNPLSAGRAASEWDPKGKAAAEVAALWAWLRGQMDPKTSPKARRKASGPSHANA